MNEKVSCAQRLKQLLSIKNIKQSELCAMTGIPKSAMSQYVSGSFEPKQDRVELIANALNVSEAWLMGYDVPMERETNNNIRSISYSEKNNSTEYEDAPDENFIILSRNAKKLSPEDREKLLEMARLMFKGEFEN